MHCSIHSAGKKTVSLHFNVAPFHRFVEDFPVRRRTVASTAKGAVYVVPSVRPTTNRELGSNIKAAGLVPCQVRFQLDRNSVVVVMKHYAMVTGNNFLDAAGMSGDSILGNAGNINSVHSFAS